MPRLQVDCWRGRRHAARSENPQARLQLRLRRAAIDRQKDDLGPLDALLRAIAVGDHSLKLATIGSAQSDLRLLVHPLDSHKRVLQGTQNQIELLDFLH